MRKGAFFFTTLEALRGIAAIMVVFRHTEGALGPERTTTSYLAVDLFFLLSGFVLAHSYGQRLKSGAISPAGFLLERVIRLYPLYLLSLPIGLASAMLSGGTDNLTLFEFALKAVAFIPSLGQQSLFPLNAPSWSLFFELWVGMVFAVFLMRLPPKSLLLVLSASAVITTIGAIDFGSFDIGHQTDYFIFGFLRVLLSFSLGVILQRQYVSEKMPIGGNALAGTLCLSLMPLIGMTMGVAFASPYFDLFCCLIAFPALIWLAIRVKPTGWLDMAFRWLGRLSYPLYILHGPIFSLLYSLRQRGYAALHSPALGWAVFFATVAASFAAAIFFDEPVRRQLWKIVRRPKTQQLATPGNPSAG